jgi:anti-sigma factor RsiW
MPPLDEAEKRRIVLQAVRAGGKRIGGMRRRSTFQPRDFVIGLVTAAALLLFVFKPFFFATDTDDMMQKFAHEASMTYGTYMTQQVPPEFVNADEKIVTNWLNTRMGFQLKMPCITDQATKLLGGRLCRLLDRKSAAMIYERNGANLLLIAFKGGHIAMPKKYKVQARDLDLYIRTISGRPVAMWNHAGMTYSMVGDLDHDDLLQVAQTIDYR